METHGLRAAIVGAGMMACGLDRDRPQPPRSHLGGLEAAGFAIAGVQDTDPRALDLPRSRGCPVFDTLDELLAAGADVVTICVPPAAQAAAFARVLAAKPKAIVCEKPLAPTLEQAEAMAAAARAAGIPVIVNYTRRFTGLYRDLRQRFLAGEQPLTATIRYAKGLRHNGTHAIDLLRFLFGEAITFEPLAAKADHWSDDPTISCFLAFERCREVFLTGLDERAFTLFEVDIIAPTGRWIVDMDNRRLRHWRAADNTGIPPGKRLVEEAASDSGYDGAIVELARHAARVALAAEAPSCTLDDGVAALRLSEAIQARWDKR